MKSLKKKLRPLLNKRPAFLAAFRATCSITEAAKAVGIDRRVHYYWLEDARYAAAFHASIPEAAGVLEDDMIEWARVGLFDPLVFQGKFQYAPRRRVLCKLADGTTAFEDELPKRANVVERRTVTTADGAQLGVYKRDAGLMAKLASAWMPEKYGTKVAVTGKDGAPLVPEEFTIRFVRPDPQ